MLCWELGRSLGRRRAAADPQGWQAGTGVIDGAAFGLLGLILGFTFSGAATRLDTRRATRRRRGERDRDGVSSAGPAARERAAGASRRVPPLSRRASRGLRGDPRHGGRATASWRVRRPAKARSGSSRWRPVDPRGCGSAAASGHQRDDRHHDHTHDRGTDACTGAVLRADRVSGARQRIARRLRDGGVTQAQLASRGRVRRDADGGGLCGRRHGLSACRASSVSTRSTEPSSTSARR